MPFSLYPLRIVTYTTASSSGNSQKPRSLYRFFVERRDLGTCARVWLDDAYQHCSEERVRRGCEKLSRAVGQKQQGRLDNFFSYVDSICVWTPPLLRATSNTREQRRPEKSEPLICTCIY